MVNYQSQLDSIGRNRDIASAILAQSFAPQQNQNALTGLARILSAHLANKRMDKLDQQQIEVGKQQNQARQQEMSRILSMTQDRPAQTLQPGEMGPAAPAMPGIPLSQALMSSSDQGFQNMGIEASLKSAMEAQKNPGYFDGGGIEGEALNRYLMSLPPDQREGAANQLAQQRLGRQTTLSTPEGTMIIPGYDLSSIKNPQAQPQQPQMVPKPPTETERVTSGFAERMKAAEAIMTGLEEQGFDAANIQDSAISKIPAFGELMTSPQYKSQKAAAEDWITANLRKESGAMISPEEFRRDYEKYFPQPLDPPEVRAQKAQARKLAEENVRFAAGKAGEQRASQGGLPTTEKPIDQMSPEEIQAEIIRLRTELGQ